MPTTERLARLLIIPLTILVALMYAIMIFGDDGGGADDPAGVEAVDTTTGVAEDSSGVDAVDTTTATGGADTTAPAPTEGGADTTAPAATEGGTGTLELAEADQTSPPAEPRGVYDQGQVTLTGSVPDEEVAAGFLRRVAGMVGEDNVVMDMTLDPRVSAETLTIEIDEQFRFPPGRVATSPDIEALLDLAVAALQVLPDATLVITGHTDAVGEEGTNQALSVANAQVVVDHMVRQGIDRDRIVARGAGESQPIAPNDTPEGREANRRVEAALEGITPG